VTLLPLLVPLLLPDWMDPEYLIHALGNWALWGVALVLIIECSIFPILPGDSLLFTVGLFIAIDPPSITFEGMSQPMVLLVSCVVLMIAAVLGNVLGYFVGRWSARRSSRNVKVSGDGCSTPSASSRPTT